ncbi:hypothetical protein K438DRAFT_1757113 [Mycena galopus ATCC 62051]|nr:hypothetical protein K438DRAFT_1757113 [Mycena galopus ATCC 62051]
MPSTIANGLQTLGYGVLFTLFTPVRWLRGPPRKNRNRPPHFHLSSFANSMPLPTTRIYSRLRPEAEQLENCFLLQLPVELRLSIYQHLLGGRLVSLRLVHSRFRSWCYNPIDDLARTPDNAVFLAEPISLSLLLVCRTIYIEARPILHQCNTFHVWASHLEFIAQCALGAYYLPDIRSVHVMYDNAAYDVVPVLQQMRGLERLAIQFAPNQLPEQTGSDPHRAVLENAWARDILGLRSLRRLELWFTPNVNGQQEHLVYNQDLVQEFRWLMIGSGADERYKAFIKEYENREQKDVL